MPAIKPEPLAPRSVRYVVEFVVDDPEAFRFLHAGDAEADFRNRAFDRVLREPLNAAMRADRRIQGWYRLVSQERQVIA